MKLVSGSLIDKRLGHYDSEKVIRLATDASPVGVGAVFSHVIDCEEVPIVVGSRTLSSSEMKYPQIEKEALSIIFGVKKFHKYLYGRKFQLLPDHKPLVTILGPQTAVSTLAALNMQRWALIIQTYQYDIEYRKSELHANADRLSRLPDPDETTGEEPSIYNVSCVNDIPANVIKIATETRKDTILSQVCEYIMAGWPNHVNDELKLYFMKRNELSMEQRCLLRGYRVVIPPKFQHMLLKELHNEYRGISQSKSFARSYIW